MKDLLQIEVECHSGYKSDEYPVRFFWSNLRFEIEEIIDRWYQTISKSGFPAANYFKVRTTDKKIFILKQETETGKWFLWIRGESIQL